MTTPDDTPTVDMPAPQRMSAEQLAAIEERSLRRAARGVTNMVTDADRLLVHIDALEAQLARVASHLGINGADADGIIAELKRITEIRNASYAAVKRERDEAIRGLLDIIHDDLTYARQRDHAVAIGKARELIKGA